MENRYIDLETVRGLVQPLESVPSLLLNLWSNIQVMQRELSPKHLGNELQYCEDAEVLQALRDLKNLSDTISAPDYCSMTSADLQRLNKPYFADIERV